MAIEARKNVRIYNYERHMCPGMFQALATPLADAKKVASNFNRLAGRACTL